MMPPMCQEVTFVLMSTGGCERREWSHCIFHEKYCLSTSLSLFPTNAKNDGGGFDFGGDRKEKRREESENESENENARNSTLRNATAAARAARAARAG